MREWVRVEMMREWGGGGGGRERRRRERVVLITIHVLECVWLTTKRFMNSSFGIFKFP